MKIELGPTVTAALAKSRAYLAKLRGQRFWVQLVALTFLALFTLATVGRSAYARADALRAEAERLSLAQAGLDRWAGTMVWPTPEETALWRESEAFFSRLGSTSNETVALVNQLATRGEEMNSGDIGIRLVSPDTAFIPPEVRVGSWVVRSGKAALVVEMTSDWASTISYLGALPPQVEVASMTVSGNGAGTRMTLLLLAREIVQEQI